MAEEPSEEHRNDLKFALIGGAVAAVVGFGGMAIVGTASSFEARRLLAAVIPTLRFAASAYVAGGATVLALMLTMITFSITHDLEYRSSHYRRIRQIAAVAMVVIVVSVVMLMFISFPLDEAGVDRDWYLPVYYGLLLGGALTGGAFISVVLMLYYAIRQLIEVGEDPATSPLIAGDGRDGGESGPAGSGSG